MCTDEPRGSSETAVPDPEVSSKARRRRFSAAYKLKIIEEAQQCTQPGALGALLRREGLYSSSLSKWREAYRAQGFCGLQDDTRGRKGATNPLEDEVARLRKENARLSGRLAQAETVIEIQKKVSSLLGIPLASAERGEGA